MVGHIWVVLSSSKWQGGTIDNIDSVASLNIPGKEHLEWFGQDLAIVRTNNVKSNLEARLLIVGAPYHRHNNTCDFDPDKNCSIDGKVYGYKLASDGCDATLQFTITGSVGRNSLF